MHLLESYSKEKKAITIDSSDKTSAEKAHQFSPISTLLSAYLKRYEFSYFQRFNDIKKQHADTLSREISCFTKFLCFFLDEKFICL